MLRASLGRYAVHLHSCKQMSRGLGCLIVLPVRCSARISCKHDPAAQPTSEPRRSSHPLSACSRPGAGHCTVGAACCTCTARNGKKKRPGEQTRAGRRTSATTSVKRNVNRSGPEQRGARERSETAADGRQEPPDAQGSGDATPGCLSGGPPSAMRGAESHPDILELVSSGGVGAVPLFRPVSAWAAQPSSRGPSCSSGNSPGRNGTELAGGGMR